MALLINKKINGLYYGLKSNLWFHHHRSDTTVFGCFQAAASPDFVLHLSPPLKPRGSSTTEPPWSLLLFHFLEFTCARPKQRHCTGYQV